MAALPYEKQPKWNGPAQGPPIVPTLGQQKPGSFPFESPEHNLFPPVCIRSHWDAENIIRRTLPAVSLATPLDPRPWTKICMNYVTSQEFEDAPRPNDSMVMPSGGTVYPPSRYRESIDNESLLRRLDRPLGTAEANQYKPPLSGGLFHTNVIDSRTPNSRFVQELAFPMACMRNSDYDCRSEAQKEAWSRSTSLFNNATKQERYSKSRPELVKRASD